MSDAAQIDDLDLIHKALQGYDSIFGAGLTGAQLRGAWKALAETRPEVVQHIDMRVRYLQACATLELGQDLAALTELAEAQLKATRAQTAILRELLHTSDDGVQVLQSLDSAWNGSPAPELEDPPEVGDVTMSTPVPADAGNVSTSDGEDDA